MAIPSSHPEARPLAPGPIPVTAKQNLLLRECSPCRVSHRRRCAAQNHNNIAGGRGSCMLQTSPMCGGGHCAPRPDPRDYWRLWRLEKQAGQERREITAIGVWGWRTWHVGNEARNEMETPKDKPIAVRESPTTGPRTPTSGLPLASGVFLVFPPFRSMNTSGVQPTSDFSASPCCAPSRHGIVSELSPRKTSAVVSPTRFRPEPPLSKRFRRIVPRGPSVLRATAASRERTRRRKCEFRSGCI